MLAKDFEASKFPHRDVISALVSVSNDSRLATYFHRDVQTLCRGCHHQSTAAAELQTPQCRNCHMVADDKGALNRTKLLSAYHGQCLGCHEKMEMTKGRKCLECHKAVSRDAGRNNADQESERSKAEYIHNSQCVASEIRKRSTLWRMNREE